MAVAAVDTTIARPLPLVAAEPAVMVMLLLHAKRPMAAVGRTRTVVTITASLVRHVADPTRAETVLRC